MTEPRYAFDEHGLRRLWADDTPLPAGSRWESLGELGARSRAELEAKPNPEPKPKPKPKAKPKPAASRVRRR